MHKIKIVLQDNTELNTVMETYDAGELVAELNDRTSEYIELGDIGVAKYSIKYFTQVTDI